MRLNYKSMTTTIIFKFYFSINILAEDVKEKNYYYSKQYITYHGV